MILLIGYGNPLRGDDGVGDVLAQQLEQRLQNRPVQILTPHQLTPELVAVIANADLVIFIDAAEGEIAGRISCQMLMSQPVDGIFTHNATPSALLAAAHDWYGVKPAGLMISIVGESFGYSDRLSPTLTTLLPTIVDETEALINAHLQTLVKGKSAETA